jgi:hypothetical protein
MLPSAAALSLECENLLPLLKAMASHRIPYNNIEFSIYCFQRKLDNSSILEDKKMRKLYPTVLLCGFILFSHIFSGNLLACDYCLLSQGISPLETFKAAGIRMNVRYTLLNSVYEGTKKIANPGAKEEYWTTEFTGFYGITEDLLLLAAVPIKNNKLDGHLHVHSDGDVEVHPDKGDQSGLGDIAVLGRYTFIKEHTIDTTTTLAALLGVKLPTGKTDGKTTDGADYLDSHQQLGTGSLDFLAGISFAYAVDRFSVSANLLDAIPTEGKAGDVTHQYGNILNYDITPKYRVYPSVFDLSEPGHQTFLALGINGELKGREKNGGAEDKNSGGHTIYLSPGIQVVAPPHWVFELTYGNPVYHNLDGKQLGEDYKINLGIAYIF